MPDEGEMFIYLSITLLLIAVAAGTIDKTGIPAPLYIGLLAIVSELIYIQLITIENKTFYDSLETNDDFMRKAHDYKLIAIGASIILIPVITIVLRFIILLFTFMQMIFEILAVLIGLIAIWLSYVYINSIPLKMMKKKFDKNKELEEESKKHPGPALD